jgi:WG containing repeat
LVAAVWYHHSMPPPKHLSLILSALLALFTATIASAKKLPNIRWSFIDKQGKTVPTATLEQQLVYPAEGLVPATPYRRSARWGFKNRSGKFVIQPQYGAAGPFVHGRALVQVVTRWEPVKGAHNEAAVDSSYGFINKKGKLVIKARYESAQSFSQGLAAVARRGRAGYINVQGKTVIPFRYTEANAFKEGLATVNPVNTARWGFINKKGKLVIPATYSWAFEFSEGLAAVSVVENNVTRWGFIDKTGKTVIKPRFHEVKSFSEQLAAVCVGIEKGKPGQTEERPLWGYIDKTGKVVIKPVYQDSTNFSEGRAAVKKVTKSGAWRWGYIDKSGKVVIKLQYHRARPFFRPGLARVGFIVGD